MLRTGDVLTLYTDGLSDAQAPRRTVSDAEMMQALARHPPSCSQDAIDALLDLAELEEGARDDIAILSAQVKALAEPARRGPITQREAGSALSEPRSTVATDASAR